MMKRLEARSYDDDNEPLTHRIPIAIPHQNTDITLETAIEPLLEFLPNLQSFVTIAREKSVNPADGLTPDQSAAIMLYSMHWEPTEHGLYYTLNAALRSENRQELKPWFSYVTLLIKALSHLPSISLSVYRLVQLDLSKKYPVGQRFIWWGFALCSLLLDTFPSNDKLDKTSVCTIFTIESHSGKDVRKHSFFPDEDQIIFPPAFEFEVISSHLNDQGQHLIHLKEIPSTKTLLHFTNGLEILSASHLFHSLQKNIPSTPSDKTVEQSIDRLLKLQLRIEKYSLYSVINLTREELTDEDIPFVIQHAIIKKRCAVLRLDENFLTGEGVTVLANFLPHAKTLLALNLYSNHLFDRGLHPLIKVLCTNNLVLQKLHLGANRISNDGAFALAEMLKTNTTLTVLLLDRNRISDDGVHFLSNALVHHNKTLQELSLKKNKLIASSSVPYFLEIFHQNQTLMKVNLRSCGLTKQDNQILEKISHENERVLFRLDSEDEDEGCVLS